MKCTHCGAEYSEGVAYCPACGQPTSQQQPVVQPQQPPVQPQPPVYGGYPQQQPYGYQPPRQPYGYQQPSPPPQPAPAYGYAPQQPVYTAPPQPQNLPASEAEKAALFSTAGSLWMLIAAIVVTINLVTGLISNILSLSILNILLVVFDIFIAVGFWIAFVNGKKKKMSSTGISLIRVPYIIKFVFTVIAFIFNLLVWAITVNIAGLLLGILTFIFDCICFASVKKSLDMARDIAQNHSVAGRKAGVFAAVVMIISSSITFIGEIVGYVTMAALLAALEHTPLAGLATLLGAGGVMTLVAAAIAFLAGISVAIVLLMFSKKIKQANG